MNKQINRQLRKLADQLPIYFVQTHEKHIMTGKEVLEETEFKEIDGKPVNIEEKYIVPQPVQIAINHHRKIKEIYKNHKFPGVKEYCEKVIAQSIINNVNNG